MAIGDDVAAFVDDDAGADHALVGGVARRHLDGDDAWLDLANGFDGGVDAGFRLASSFCSGPADGQAQDRGQRDGRTAQ